MREIAALAIGFSLIIIMLFKKVQIGTTMLTASIVMGLLAGFGSLKTLRVFFTSIIERSTIELLVVVAIICILSYVLEKYGTLNKMADSLEALFNNNWFSLMFLPLLVGVLSVPGGAVMSAPVVDSVGDKLKLNNVRKSVINVVFRHVSFFLFPFSTAMILTSQITGLSPYTIIKYNIPIALVSITAGYMLYVRESVANTNTENRIPDKNIIYRIGAVLLYTSPLWVGIVLSIALGVPFYLALAPGIAIVYFLQKEGKKDYLEDITKGINWKMMYSVAGIMVLQGFIKQMPAIAQFINTLLETGMDIRILIILSTAVVGLLTANNVVVIGMLLPLFLPLATDSITKAHITSLIFLSGFLFYFISPLHLCQVFTAEYFNVKIKELYREYRIYWPVLTITMVILYFFIY